MYIFFNTKCNILKEYATKRIDGISSKSNGKKVIEKLKAKAKARIQLEERDKRLQQERDERIKQDLLDNLEREKRYRPAYLPTTDDDDMSELLGDW
ncbi:hypothetical protein CV093_10175 [Oceanobacillus sp. 143]|nr:hypothetical protein CV093_10175 [Oceanobacillus sp. 143]